MPYNGRTVRDEQRGRLPYINMDEGVGTQVRRAVRPHAAAAWPKRHPCVYTRTGYLGLSSGASFDTALQYISLSSDTRGYLPVPVQLYRYLVVPVTKFTGRFVLPSGTSR